MATLADEILSCMLRSFCFDHAMSFERLHTNFPKTQEYLESPEADKTVMWHIFQPFPHTMTVDRWRQLRAYLKSDEGQEYRRFYKHWVRYAKLCLDGCKRCYLKEEGTEEEKYVMDRMYMLAKCTKAAAKREMEKRYPTNYGTYLLNQARKRRRLRENEDSFVAVAGESQGSS